MINMSWIIPFIIHHTKSNYCTCLAFLPTPPLLLPQKLLTTSSRTLEHSTFLHVSTSNNDNSLVMQHDDENDNDEDEDDQPEFPGTRHPNEPNDKAILQSLSYPPFSASILSITRDAPKRYLLPILSNSNYNSPSLENTNTNFVMMDVPPYSPELHSQIVKHIQTANTETLSSSSSNHSHSPLAMLITNQNSIHYKDSQGKVYSKRQSDLLKWKQSFPDMVVVIHRIDVFRDLNVFVDVEMIEVDNDNDNFEGEGEDEGDGEGDGEEESSPRMKSIPLLTQVLDGYGPWAWDTSENRFVETGKPLTILEWDDSKVAEFFESGMEPNPNPNPNPSNKNNKEEEETKNEIEETSPLLAVYTPGHTMGSVTYIVPSIQTCVSGFTIPPPDTNGRLDYKGYISTNRATIGRQVQSVREELMMDKYIEKFQFVLPSRGDSISLEEEEEEENYDQGGFFVEEDDNDMDIYAKNGNGIMDNTDTDTDDSSMEEIKNKKTQKRKRRLEAIISRFEKIGSIYDSLGITKPA